MRRRRVLNLRAPSRWTVALIAVTLGLVALALPNVAVQTAERPAYLATAILADGSDRNVQVFAGHAASEAVQYDASGHAELPSWTAKPAVVPGIAVPWTPRMGWSVAAYMEPVASGLRPLRYCADPLRAFDATHNDHTTAIAVRALTAKFRGPFDSGQSFAILPLWEDCTRPDIVLHADADSTTQGCSGQNTLACAALLADAGRPVTYVSFGGGLRTAGKLPDRCVEAAIWHEGGHAGDLGHSGRYGGEGRRHPHPSDEGYMNMQDCRPEDNPSDRPALADWQSQTGHEFAWGFQLAVTPTPTPLPTPTPTPTPIPTPDPASWDAWFNRLFNWIFNLGWCAARPAHPGCQEGGSP